MEKLTKQQIKKIIRLKEDGFLLGQISWITDISLDRLNYLFDKQLKKNMLNKYKLKFK